MKMKKKGFVLVFGNISVKNRALSKFMAENRIMQFKFDSTFEKKNAKCD